MLIRDPDTPEIWKLYQELIDHCRQVLVILIDFDVEKTPFITTDFVFGIGWDSEPQPFKERQLRWIGDKFSPAGHGSCDLGGGKLGGLGRLQSFIDLKLEDIRQHSEIPPVVYPQKHIISFADAEKLWRFMGRHHSIYAVKS